jgi:hypothetical protein
LLGHDRSPARSTVPTAWRAGRQQQSRSSIGRAESGELSCLLIVTTLGHCSAEDRSGRIRPESSIPRRKVALAAIFLLPWLTLLWFPKAAAKIFVQAPAGST